MTTRILPLWTRLLLCAALVLGASGLTGCDSIEPNPEDLAAESAAPADSKLRHGHLLDQAARPAVFVETEQARLRGETPPVLAHSGTGDDDEGFTGLIVGLDTYKVLSRYGELDLQKVISRYTEPDTYRVLSRYDDPDLYKVISRYEYDEVFDGFAIWVSDEVVGDVINDLSADEDIAWIEPDIKTRRHKRDRRIVTGHGEEGRSWGTDRIGYAGGNAATVDLFVMDTGVETSDVTFAGGIDFTGEDQPGDDRDGHGTHIAGTAAALANGVGMEGVAPGARIHSLRVLTGEEADDDGPVDLSKAIAALEHVVGYKLAHPERPVVLNMSLGAEVGTTAYNALDEAVVAATQNGVVVVVAAGNSGIDASTVTPAHVTEAITVGAYDLDDRFASFSNHGAVVDILAPGVDIASLRNADDSSLAVMSGTSMAAGFVSGAVAAYLSQEPNATPAQVQRLLTQSARASITGAPSGTTNRTAYLGDGGFMDENLPPFFQYAVFSNKDIELDKETFIGVEGGAKFNASVFSNHNLKVKETTVRVEGFGYYTDNVDEDRAAVAFAPRFNPTNLPGVMPVPSMLAPEFAAWPLLGRATRHHDGDLELAGHYDLGTREDPVVWFINGKLKTAGPTTISGYGIFIVANNVELKHPIETTDAASETTLGLYTGGNFKIDADGVVLTAQIYARDDVEIKGGHNVLYGSITSGNNVKLNDQTEVYYRPGSAALTRMIWDN